MHHVARTVVGLTVPVVLTLLSVIETCRQQDRNVFAFVTEALERHFAHRYALSLLSWV